MCESACGAAQALDEFDAVLSGSHDSGVAASPGAVVYRLSGFERAIWGLDLDLDIDAAQTDEQIGEASAYA